MSDSSFSQSSESEKAVAPPVSGRWMFWPWIVLFVAVALFVGYRLSGPQDRPGAGANHPAVGTRLEAIRLEPLTGGGPRISSGDLQGKVTLVNFWGPWCPPCRMEFPHIQEIEQHYRSNEDFRFLSIAYPPPGSGEDVGPWTAEFLVEFKANFATYHDPERQFLNDLTLAAKLDGFAFPTSVVLDRQGVIRGLWVGYMPGDERDIQAVIEQTLRAMVPASPAGK